MKKSIIVLSLILVSVMSFGQYSKDSIINVPGMTSKEIYGEVKEVISLTFKKSYEVIDVDVLHNKFVVKGSDVVKVVYNNTRGKKNYIKEFEIPYNITIIVTIKEGKFKYDVYSNEYSNMTEEQVYKYAQEHLDRNPPTPLFFESKKKYWFRENEVVENYIRQHNSINNNIKFTIDKISMKLKMISAINNNW